MIMARKNVLSPVLQTRIASKEVEKDAKMLFSCPFGADFSTLMRNSKRFGEKNGIAYYIKKYID